ncbi:MAG: PEGA domain-containing protein [Kofleriaceae bacterium]
MRIRVHYALRQALCLCLCLLLFESYAAAQSADALKKAQDAFDKAQQEYLAGNYDAAAAGFQAAYEARPYSQFLYNVAASFHMKGKKTGDAKAYGSAVEFYRKYLSSDPKAADRARIEKTVLVLENEAKRLASLPPPAAPDPTAPPDPSKPPEANPTASQEIEQLGDVAVRGLVVLDSEPAGATIYLDDKRKGAFGTTPWSGSLEGEHKVIFERRGYKVVETRLAADPNRLVAFKAGLPEADYLGFIEITSNVPGADVFIGDKSVGAVGKTPFSENRPPGKYKVWVSTDGYDEFSQEIEVVRGEALTVKAQLKGSPVGKLNITGPSIEEATVYLDGKVFCERGPCLKSVPEGRHELSIRRPDHKPYTKMITIQAKTETAVKAGLAPKPSRTDAIVAYVLAGGFAAGGVVLGMRANDLRDELKKEIAAGAPPPDDDDPRFQRGKIYAIAADGMYVVAGVTALTAVYYTFRDKGAPSTALIDVRALALTPQLGPNYAGLDMEVRW